MSISTSSSSSGNLRARNRSFNISGDQTQTAPPPPSPPVTDSGGNIMEEENGNYYHDEGPPVDDCCPICFGSFTVPCKSSCGHWYCGSCIMRYWSYCAVTLPCKCPMCTCRITKFTPESSLLDRKEDDVVRVLGQVEEYNSLFVGGMRGLVQKVRRSPLLVKRFFLRLMDPDTPLGDFFFLFRMMRCFSELLGVLYIGFSFNFIPTGGLVEVTGLFECAGIVLVVVLRLVGIYRRHRLQQRVRAMAAANPLLEE